VLILSEHAAVMSSTGVLIVKKQFQVCGCHFAAVIYTGKMVCVTANAEVLTLIAHRQTPRMAMPEIVPLMKTVMLVFASVIMYFGATAPVEPLRAVMMVFVPALTTTGDSNVNILCLPAQPGLALPPCLARIITVTATVDRPLIQIATQRIFTTQKIANPTNTVRTMDRATVTVRCDVMDMVPAWERVARRKENATVKQTGGVTIVRNLYQESGSVTETGMVRMTSANATVGRSILIATRTRRML
jgi:hypothetical protein